MTTTTTTDPVSTDEFLRRASDAPLFRRAMLILVMLAIAGGVTFMLGASAGHSSARIHTVTRTVVHDHYAIHRVSTTHTVTVVPADCKTLIDISAQLNTAYVAFVSHYSDMVDSVGGAISPTYLGDLSNLQALETKLKAVDAQASTALAQVLALSQRSATYTKACTTALNN